MLMSELLPLAGQGEISERRYDECLCGVMKTRDGRDLLLYILRDLCYFGNVKDEETKIVRSAAVRLLERVFSATGFQLNNEFVH
jgi:hypothetical protein